MPVIKIESSSGGEIPALLNAISMRLYVSKATLYILATCSSLVTSALTNMPPTSVATLLPAISLVSTTTTLAPSAARRTDAA